MSSEKKVVEEKISRKTWFGLIVYIIAINAFISTLTVFNPFDAFAAGLNAGPSGGVFMYMVLPYVVSFLLTFPIGWGWLKIDKRTMALIYVATMIGVWYSVSKGIFTIIDSLFNVRISTADVHSYAVPYFWIPSADAIRGMFYHGSLGNLFVTYASEWAPVALTWIFYYVTSALYMLGWASVLRRLWVDIEVLPFPHAQGWLIAENALQTTPSRPKRLMMIAAAVGFIIWIPYMIRAISPAFPDLYGWLTSPYFAGASFGTYYMSSQFTFLQQILPAPLYVALDPFRYALLLLIPLDSLFSMWFSYVLMVYFIPYVLFYIGYYPGIFTIGAGKTSMIFWSAPYHLFTIVQGFALGIFVFLILVNWRYFVETIKLAISDKPPEGELSYRTAYGLMLLGAIGWLILFVLSKVNFPIAFLGLLIVTLQAITMTRMRAYAGAVARVQGVYFWKPFLGDTVPPAPQVNGGQLFMVSHTCRWGIGADTWGPYMATLGGALDSFKVASMAEVHPKTILKLLVIGAIVSAIVTTVVILVELHAWGFMELPALKEDDFIYDGDAGYYNGRLSIVSLQGLIGFVLSAFLILMRARFAWWPIEPMGFVVGIGAGWAISYIGLPLSPFIAWVLKYAILRVGGRKAFEEVALPIAMGDIAGEMTGVILTFLLSIIRVMVLKA